MINNINKFNDIDIYINSAKLEKNILLEFQRDIIDIFDIDQEFKDNLSISPIFIEYIFLNRFFNADIDYEMDELFMEISTMNFDSLYNVLCRNDIQKNIFIYDRSCKIISDDTIIHNQSDELSKKNMLLLNYNNYFMNCDYKKITQNINDFLNSENDLINNIDKDIKIIDN
jgi:hypothetical protein